MGNQRTPRGDVGDVLPASKHGQRAIDGVHSTTVNVRGVLPNAHLRWLEDIQDGVG